MKEAYPNHHDEELVRFLIANDYDSIDASDAFDHYLKWRRNLTPISREEFDEQMKFNRLSILQMNEQRGLIYFLSRNHYPWMSAKQTIRAGVALFDMAMKVYPSLEVHLIVNTKGFKMKNLDLKLMQKAVRIYEDYFPEKLGKAYIIGMTPALIKVWEIVQKTLDTRNRDRFVLLKDSEFEVLQETYGSRFLPCEIGGECLEPTLDNIEQLVQEYWVESSECCQTQNKN